MLRHHKHALVVDDDRELRLMLRAMLQDAGFFVTGAGSGPEMRQIIDAGGVDLVLLDVRLPGGETDLAAHAKAAGIPCIMMSGDPVSMQRFAERGHQLLPKPFRLADLLMAAQRALDSGVAGQRTEAEDADGIVDPRAQLEQRAAAYRRAAERVHDPELRDDLLTAASRFEAAARDLAAD